MFWVKKIWDKEEIKEFQFEGHYIFYQVKVSFFFGNNTFVLAPCQSLKMCCENTTQHHCACFSPSESEFQISGDFMLKA